MKNYKGLLLTIGIFLFAVQSAEAIRIKDIASISGVRDNQLIGYGLLVGLNKTGDQVNNSRFSA